MPKKKTIYSGDTTNLQELITIISGIVGEKVWKVERGYKQMLYLDIGKEMEDVLGVRGQWYLETHASEYRIRCDDTEITSDDPLEEIITIVSHYITDQTIKEFSIDSSNLSLEIFFDNHCAFRILTDSEMENQGEPHWSITIPDNKIAIVGPGYTWEINTHT